MSGQISQPDWSRCQNSIDRVYARPACASRSPAPTPRLLDGRLPARKPSLHADQHVDVRGLHISLEFAEALGYSPVPEDISAINAAVARPHARAGPTEDTTATYAASTARAAPPTLARRHRPVQRAARRPHPGVRRRVRPAFVDDSRPGGRRWYAMERCETLTKVRRHRTG
ncbi:CGNR zinc finger domain-containing protein [Nocardia sp. NPDC050793]|uniref:CGNR zinc finger domain-containing protein n=1 Tax=Nocardia sp. NPDC050793 TaxID=3155159 RepID=UPI0033FBAEFD